MKLLLLVLTTLFCFTQFYAQKKEVVVVIDAGHGGTDPGNLSDNPKHMQEKEINLAIALKMGEYVTSLLQNVKVIYTRTDDSFVSLGDRVEKANSKNADIFISIHCNASPRKSIAGTESHVNSFKSKDAVDLARIFEKEFSNRVGRKSRGVKTNDDRQHSLQLLKFTKMTSVLVECGFMTNVNEAVFLNTSQGQDLLASALFRGLRTYLQSKYPSISFIKAEPKADEKKKEASSTAKYYVQISSSKEEIAETHESFKRTGEKVQREKINTTSAYKYRYVIGPFDTKAAASEVKERVAKKGFPDAIIIEK